MLRKLVAGLGVLIALLIAAPTAAIAATTTAAPSYVPGEVAGGTVAGQPAPGAALSAEFDRAFRAGEAVTLVVSCPGLDDMEIDDVADADGSTSTPFTVPDGAAGTCTVSARGVSSGAAAVAFFTIDAGSPSPIGGGADGGADAGADDGLAVTGGSMLAALWFGVGGVVVGGALLLVARLRRSSAV